MSDEYELIEPLAPRLGGAETLPADDTDDHGPHAFLAVPDGSSITGWAEHRVPDRREPARERRPIGFRRNER